jgi:hypothetical protein
LEAAPYRKKVLYFALEEKCFPAAFSTNAGRVPRGKAED